MPIDRCQRQPSRVSIRWRGRRAPPPRSGRGPAAPCARAGRSRSSRGTGRTGRRSARRCRTTEKSDSLIWIDSRSFSASALAAASARASVSARPVGEARAMRARTAPPRSPRGRWPTSSRPDAVQFSGTRVPTRDVTRKWPGPSAIASTTMWSPSRPQICTVSSTVAAQVVHLVGRDVEEIERLGDRRGRNDTAAGRATPCRRPRRCSMRFSTRSSMIA